MSRWAYISAVIVVWGEYWPEAVHSCARLAGLEEGESDVFVNVGNSCMTMTEFDEQHRPVSRYQEMVVTVCGNIRDCTKAEARRMLDGFVAELRRNCERVYIRASTVMNDREMMKLSEKSE